MYGEVEFVKKTLQGLAGFVALGFVVIMWPAGKEAAKVVAKPTANPSSTAELQSYKDIPQTAVARNANMRRSASQSDAVRPVNSGNVLTYDIKPGDSLSSIFDQLGLGQAVMYQVLSADESLLALDMLQPGPRLIFTTNPDSGKLTEMELFIHAGKQVSYRRVNAETFEYEEKITDGEWPMRVIAGEVQGSFYESARAVGLKINEVAEINRLFSARINFSADLRAGDKFEVLRSEQKINGVSTGETRIKGVHFYLTQGLFTAYLFEDGNYYDERGHSLARAFRQSPLRQQARISSGFNPRRTNPVTGQVAPHNGTDYAIWTGNVVVSTGDGVVTKVANHPYAGKYVEIEHGRRYTTRYLHLSKITVQQGSPIERGEKIGLSGATGRVTGPNLHYEFHVNNRPVNYQTADMPVASAVPKERIALFRKQAEELSLIMDNAEPTRLARPI